MFRLHWLTVSSFHSRIVSCILMAVFILFGWFGVMPVAVAQPLNVTPIMASLFHFSGTRPENLGLEAGQLQPCSSTPNCVSSQSADGSHAIAALGYRSSASEAFDQLKSIIQALPRTEIIAEASNYLYAEVTSEFMGFVDDVEFYLDEGAHEIQVRSASRLGESDLGVNRKRVEQIRSLLNEKQAALAIKSVLKEAL